MKQAVPPAAVAIASGSISSHDLRPTASAQKPMEIPVRTNAQNPTKKLLSRTNARNERGPTHTPSHHISSRSQADSPVSVTPSDDSELRRRSAIPDLILLAAGVSATLSSY